MSEKKAREQEKVRSTLGRKRYCVPFLAPKDGGARCRRLWPASGRGKVIVILVALAALGIVVVWELLRPDLARLQARHERLEAAGEHVDAARVLGVIVDVGMDLYRARRFDEATTVFEWVVSKDPRRAVALTYLGVMARDRAEADAKRANEAQGTGPNAPPRVTANYDKAIAWFTRATEIDPLSPMHFYNLALIHLARKDYAACETQIEQAMKLSPKAQYRLVWALCAQEGLQPLAVTKKRLHDTTASAEAQVSALSGEDLSPTGALANAWMQAARRLADLGDNTGWDRLRELATDSPRDEVREFARALLAVKR